MLKATNNLFSIHKDQLHANSPTALGGQKGKGTGSLQLGSAGCGNGCSIVGGLDVMPETIDDLLSTHSSVLLVVLW
jgi:hypothetical protein